MTLDNRGRIWTTHRCRATNRNYFVTHLNDMKTALVRCLNSVTSKWQQYICDVFFFLFSFFFCNIFDCYHPKHIKQIVLLFTLMLKSNWKNHRNRPQRFKTVKDNQRQCASSFCTSSHHEMHFLFQNQVVILKYIQTCYHNYHLRSFIKNRLHYWFLLKLS